MINIKFAVPFLLAVLFVPVGVSFAQTTPGDEDYTDEIRPVGNTGADIKLLKQQGNYQNMTSQQQEKYVQSANEFITAQSAYELDRNQLMVKSSTISLQCLTTSDGQRKQELTLQHDETWKQLEKFGVEPTDEVFENSDYYFDKCDQKLQEYEEQCML